jgi:DNA-directed RNA polymerase specialized sigma subunit
MEYFTNTTGTAARKRIENDVRRDITAEPVSGNSKRLRNQIEMAIGNLKHRLRRSQGKKQIAAARRRKKNHDRFFQYFSRTTPRNPQRNIEFISITSQNTETSVRINNIMQWQQTN